MAGWDWLTKPQTPYNRRFVRNVVIKGVLLFIALNWCYALTNPLPFLSRITLYNSVLPGRERLPYSENPTSDYNISVQRLEGMFASIKLSQTPKADDEYRVFFLGDSSVWGWLLEEDETLSACINRGNYRMPDGRRLVIYNLGYPVTNVLKDSMLLEASLQYEPDLAVWFLTLAGFYIQDQLKHQVVQNNADLARDLIERYDLALDESRLPDDPNLWERSIIGQRRELADLLRHQVYGVAWLATGYDHRNPKFHEQRVENLLPGDDLLGMPRIEGGWTEDLLSFDVMLAGMDIAQNHDLPVLVVNEPIFRTSGFNNENRYNDYYPKWAYDSYRELLASIAQRENWHYSDLWDAAPNDQFTNTGLHLTPAATCEFAHKVVPYIMAMTEQP